MAKILMSTRTGDEKPPKKPTFGDACLQFVENIGIGAIWLRRAIYGAFIVVATAVLVILGFQYNTYTSQQQLVGMFMELQRDQGKAVQRNGDRIAEVEADFLDRLAKSEQEARASRKQMQSNIQELLATIEELLRAQAAMDAEIVGLHEMASSMKIVQEDHYLEGISNWEDASDKRKLMREEMLSDIGKRFEAHCRHGAWINGSLLANWYFDDEHVEYARQRLLRVIAAEGVGYGEGDCGKKFIFVPASLMHTKSMGFIQGFAAEIEAIVTPIGKAGPLNE